MYVITGGKGFIGSALVKLLLAETRQHLIVVDNESSSHSCTWRKRLIGADETRITFIQSTVSNALRDPGLWSDEIEMIFHLAGPVGPAGVLDFGGRIASEIISTAVGLADKANAIGARLVFVSTSEVYGGLNDGLCREEQPKLVLAKNSARQEYAVSKLASEIALLNKYELNGLDVNIIRPFNVAGPGQRAFGGFVLPRFINQAKKGLDLTVYGDGSDVRAFTHVDDMARGIYLAGISADVRGEVFNIGNEKNKIAIAELAEKVIERFDGIKVKNVDPKSIHGRYFVGAPDKYPDSKKALKELKWSAFYSLDQIIDDTIEFMSDIPDDY